MPQVRVELDSLAEVDDQDLATAVAAYSAAFTARDGARLQIRARYGALHRRGVELLRHLASGRPDIELDLYAADRRAASPEPARPAVVLCTASSAPVGVAALDGFERGDVVILAGAAPALAGRADPRVIRVPPVGDRGAAGSLGAVVEALRGVLSQGSSGAETGPDVAATSGEAPGGGPVSLVRAATRRPQRLDRADLWPLVAGPVDEVARLGAELAALRSTKVIRYTTRLRVLYGALRRRS
jgi:hypothetical protein